MHGFVTIRLDPLVIELLLIGAGLFAELTAALIQQYEWRAGLTSQRMRKRKPFQTVEARSAPVSGGGTKSRSTPASADGVDGERVVSNTTFPAICERMIRKLTLSCGEISDRGA